MKTTGLLFIPDISGFTRFVKEVEIDHSRLIIQELLETLIDANDSGLVVSEIEGDAILFYKFGEKPSLGELYKQVEQMFRAFHKTLIAYASRKYCQCKACLTAINLSLKVVTHYGEFTEYNVKNFNKLIGRDVIVAHQLLKNNIDQHEYWLVTKGLLQDDLPSNINDSIKWVEGRKTTEEDEIPFRYAQLGYLKSEITIDPPKKPDLTTRRKAYSLTMEYDTDIITLLHASADFTYRNRWVQGVESVEVQNHFLPRVGMRCIMTLKNGKATAIANHYIFNEHEVEFSEIDERTGHLSYYKLERLEHLRTRLTLNYYISNRIISNLLFRLTKKRIAKGNMEKSLHNLTELVEQIGDSVRRKGTTIFE